VSGQTFKAGSVISVPSYTTNRSRVWGDDPSEFRPERWLGDKSSSLNKYFVPFSLGPRSVLSMVSEMFYVLMAMGLLGLALVGTLRIWNLCSLLLRWSDAMMWKSSLLPSCPPLKRSFVLRFVVM
ncbi:unnamed protein product, partial [Rhizoctonia solani]